MKCNSCFQDYDITDIWPGAGNGWHPDYGTCAMCYSYQLFGGMLEPNPETPNWGGFFDIKPLVAIPEWR